MPLVKTTLANRQAMLDSTTDKFAKNVQGNLIFSKHFKYFNFQAVGWDSGIQFSLNNFLDDILSQHV